MIQKYCFAVLACFAATACCADGITVFDLSAYIGPVTNQYGITLPDSTLTFTGTLTYDLDTGQLASFDIDMAGQPFFDSSSPYVTVAHVPSYGQSGQFEFVIDAGPIGTLDPVYYWPFVFSAAAALGSEPVISVTDVNYIQYDSGPYGCGYCFPDDTPRGGTLTQETQAPEIDPASAGAGLTLLAGLVAAMRGRRRVAQQI